MIECLKIRMGVCRYPKPWKMKKSEDSHIQTKKKKKKEKM